MLFLMASPSSLDKKKVVVIGDGACGKTCLLMVYITGQFPTEYIPTVFDNHIKEIDVDGTSTPTLLMDTSGQEDYERLRTLQYLDTNAFIVCFSIDSRTSFNNVKLLWMPEIKHFKVPVVLVGTKLDLRGVIDNSIKRSEGEALAKKIRASAYIECSAKISEGVDNVFETTTRVMLNPKVYKGRNRCVLF